METITSRRNVFLSDCTLGVGGELISWNYGEHEISTITQLLLRSGLEVIEYGLLSGSTSGPNAAVYTSTLLPFEINRREGQQYALLLNRKDLPLLSKIPDSSEKTADILRVYLTRTRTEAELQYCAELSRKGYQIALLIEETGQYTDEELSALLRRANALHPWGCYIFDSSGILDEDELQRIFPIFETELSEAVRIGFHGRNNAQRAETLARTFSRLPVQRDLCVDVSAGGMGAGALHLPSETQAEWMNGCFGTAYDLSALEFLSIKTEPYTAAKKNALAKLLYNAAAKQKCSYRYVEYYCDMSIDLTIQLETYSEIERSSRFRFSKAEANKALLLSQKKKLNLAIVILTAGHPKRIEHILRHEADNLLKSGARIMIFDGSSDRRTHAVVLNYQLENYSNILYRRYCGDDATASPDAMIKAAFAANPDCDYVWLLRDDLVPTVSCFRHDLLSQTAGGAEVIVVDAAFRNNNRFCVKRYDDNLEFFAENSARLSLLGSCILKHSLVEKLLTHPLSDQPRGGFWMVDALLQEIAAQKAKTALIVSNSYYYDQISFQKSFFTPDIFDQWGNRWYEMIMALPAFYDPAKRSAVRIQMYDMHPFHLKSMLYLRAAGCYSLSVYRQWKDRLLQISDTSKTKLCLAALFPRSLAKIVLSASSYQLEHPNTLFSKLAGKLYHLYVRLGR